MAPRPPAPDAARRAQFCYANKVINLGTFATEEEAARVWNEAALLFRGCIHAGLIAGADAWLDPVEPQLPEDYKAGELHLASDKAAFAVMSMLGWPRRAC